MILRHLRTLQRPMALRPSAARSTLPAGLRGPLAQPARVFGTGERKQVMAVESALAPPGYEMPPFTVQQFDPSNPLIVPRFNNVFQAKRTGPTTSLSGNINDLFPYFAACIATGKLDRAELVLVRIHDLTNGSIGDQLIELHNRYLRACIERLQEIPSQLMADHLHRWYEGNIRAQNLPQTVETIACMVKISLLSTKVRSMARNKLIARYMGMAPGDAGYGVLFHEDIIDDQDLEAVRRVCPEYEIITEDEAVEPETDADFSAEASEATESDGPAKPTGGKFTVRATPQKGVGLVSLKKALHLMDSMKNGFDISTLSTREQVELQRRLELDSVEAAVERWREEAENLRKVGAADATATPGMRSRLYEWQVALEKELRNEIERCDLAESAKHKTMEDHDRCAYGAFLKQGSVRRMAAVTLLTVLNMSVSTQSIDRGLPIIALIPKIGSAIEDDIRALLAREHEKKVARARRRMVRSPEKVTEEEKRIVQEADDAKAAWRARMEAKRQSVLARIAAERSTESQLAGSTTATTTTSEAGKEGQLEEQQQQQQQDELEAQYSADAEPELSAEEQADLQAEAEKLMGMDMQSEAAESEATPSEASAEAPAEPDAAATPPSSTSNTIDPVIGFEWTTKIRGKVGAAVLTALINTAEMKVVARDDNGFMVSEQHPVFQHSIQLRKGKKIGFLLFHPELCRILRTEPTGDFLAKHLPMIVEPRPWSGINSGGFLATNTTLMRFKNGDRDQRIYAEAAMERHDMTMVLQGLDVLGKTAWRINHSLFEVMTAAWNTGEEIANFPALGAKVPIPPEPESEDVSVRAKWMSEVKKAKGEEMGLHSVRCSVNFQLEIARAFRDQTIYFPHNVDFRGRAYPMPTYLNHMGADHVRGLLIFAKGKALGESGLRWLKVHLANVFGFDKASLAEREAFSDEHKDDIFDSATNALGGKRWWLKAEDPWQCLATCMELKAALDSPNPAEFVSHMPVHQDGTCNGLQHYAALGGDEWGARQVNLEPGERPADVYTAVADLVKDQVARDIIADNEFSKFAKAVEGKITRKVVKQTVMTNVYGVTFAGARAQVRRQLADLYPTIEQDTGFPPMVLAYYVAKLVFSAMGNMFKGAHDIQSWLGDCGGRVCLALMPDQIGRISRGETTMPNLAIHKKLTLARSIAQEKKEEDELPNEFQTSIVWTTPLRMPVSQPYRKSRVQLIETCLQDIQFSTPDRTDPVNRRKQLQAFPPNFIHSLDASHMLLSALNCDRLGMTFAAVHDSFWTHACDVDSMNVVLRDSFIDIHSEPVIERLAAEFKARYRGSLYHARVDDGSAAAVMVKAWRKKNSKSASLKGELLLEYNRQRLLHSNNPDDVLQGKQMVTPASIFEKFKGEVVSGLASEDDLQGTRLGLVSEQGSSNDDAEVDALSVSHTSEPQSESDGIIDDGASPSESASGDLSDAEREAQSVVFMQKVSEKALSGAQNSLDRTGKSTFAEKIVRNVKQKAAAPAKAYVHIWLPLEFPPVPEKGSFDVKRLRGSQYFFS